MKKEWKKSVAVRIQSIVQGLVLCSAFAGQNVIAATPKAVVTQDSACAWSIVERKRVLTCGDHIATYSYDVADERLVSQPYPLEVDVAGPTVVPSQTGRYAINEMAPGVEPEDEFYEDLNDEPLEEMPLPPSIPAIPVADAKPKIVSQYMVVTIASELELKARLKDFADDDYLILRSSPLENRVSLGVFSTIENARTRSGQAAKFQIETEVIDRASSKPIARLAPRNLLNQHAADDADANLLSSMSD